MDKNGKQETKIEKVTSEAMEEALSGPAVYANKAYLTQTSLGCRITFVEAHENQPPPKFRNAVFLTWPDFIAFRELLKNADVQITTSQENPK